MIRPACCAARYPQEMPEDSAELERPRSGAPDQDESSGDLPARGAILVGTQGFSYDEWDGLVYAPGAPKNARLATFAQQFSLVELDSTYYGAPRPAQVARWAEQTPETFTFTAKVPKQIAQEARLAGADTLHALEEFLDTMQLLGTRLGAIVFQMSPGFRYPRDFAALKSALAVARGRVGPRLRLAVEFRHPSWLESDTVPALLREHHVAWVWNDWYPAEPYLEKMPRAIDTPDALRITSDEFAYLRLTGNHAECVDYRNTSIDRTSDLAKWADLVLEFRRGRESRGVYVLLNNHYAGSSPLTARALERMLGLPVVEIGQVTPRDGDPEGEFAASWSANSVRRSGIAGTGERRDAAGNSGQPGQAQQTRLPGF